MMLYEIGFKSGRVIRIDADPAKLINEMYAGMRENPNSPVQVWGYDGGAGGGAWAICVSDVSYVLPVSALRDERTLPMVPRAAEPSA